jgi:hypothetical protein
MLTDHLPAPPQPAVTYYPQFALPFTTRADRAWQKLKTPSSQRPEDTGYIKARRGHDFVHMVAVFRAPAKSRSELTSSATYLHDGPTPLGKPLLRRFDRTTADRLILDGFRRYGLGFFRGNSALLRS